MGKPGAQTLLSQSLTARCSVPSHGNFIFNWLWVYRFLFQTLHQREYHMPSCLHTYVFMWSIQEGTSPRLRGRSVQGSTCGDQRTACANLYSPSTLWAPAGLGPDEPSCQSDSTSFLCILSLYFINKSPPFSKVLI